MKLGQATVDNLLLGANQAAKLYRGSNELWNISMGSLVAWLSLNGDLTTVNGVRYLVNSKGDDVESTTGHGVYFNGVDQRLA